MPGRNSISEDERERLEKVAETLNENEQVLSGDGASAVKVEVQEPPQLSPADLERLRLIIGAMVTKGAKIEGGGVFNNAGYRVDFKYTEVKIGVDGWIELCPRGAQMIRVPLRVQDLFALATIVTELKTEGRVAAHHGND